MKLVEISGFSTILKKSIQLLTKSWRFMVPITTLSLILPSLFLLLFDSLCRFAIRFMINNQPNSSRYVYIPPLIAVEIALLQAFITFSDVLSLATIHVSAMTFVGKTISLPDLCSHVVRTWRIPASRTLRGSRKSGLRLILIGGSFYILIITKLINLVTIVASVSLSFIYMVYALYTSILFKGVAAVVVVVEENFYEGNNAMKRAEQLVEGQRPRAFLVNLFDRFMPLVSFACFWMMNGDKRASNLTVYGLFFVNVYSVQRIFRSAASTALYFRCKKFHGEEVAMDGDEDHKYTYT